jgi:hypothetical protein
LHLDRSEVEEPQIDECHICGDDVAECECIDEALFGSGPDEDWD